METPSSYYKNDTQLQIFRQRAEAIIKTKGYTTLAEFGDAELHELLHELQVFQIELEMQNDELRTSHEHLEAERSKFAGLYDLAPVGYFILNNIGLIMEANTTGIDMVGGTRRGMINKRFQDYLAPGENDVLYNFISNMRVFHTKHNCQLKLITKSGNLFYVQVEGTGVVNKINGETQFYVAVIDITKRREAEQHLIDSNERLKMTLEASLTGTWEVDLKKQKIIFDENSYTIYGFKPWAFDGKYETFFKLVHPLDRENVKSMFFAAIGQEKELDTEYRVVLEHSGTRHIAVRGHWVYKNAGDSRFVGIFIDITEKTKLQEEAENLRMMYQKSITTAGLQAQEKERKRISEELHDSVCQLLYGIKLNLQNHSRTNELTEPLNNINSLLDSAIQQTRNISFELAPSILTDFGLLEGVREMAKRLSTPGFIITVKMTGLQSRLKADLEISAFRIIQELVNNSIKHAQATEARIKIDNEGNFLNIQVCDNGKGFNTSNSEYLLSGSGLRSVRNRVDLFNGRLDIKSIKNKGVNVEVSLKIE